MRTLRGSWRRPEDTGSTVSSQDIPNHTVCGSGTNSVDGFRETGSRINNATLQSRNKTVVTLGTKH